MLTIKHIPLPYFTIDQEFNILEASDFACDIFGEALNFLDIVDIESKRKAQSLLSEKVLTTEIVMKTQESPYALFQIKVNWEYNQGHLICIEQDNRIQTLIDTVELHRRRLSETNFELLEKKEQLEQSLTKIVELSAPFICLTKGLVLVPLFGELNENMIRLNHYRLLSEVSQNQVERVLFDFHGIGEIKKEGIQTFKTLVTELKLMGTDSYMIGLSPSHARLINQLGIKAGTSYMKDLHEAIKTFIV
ncbi:STAS domain-containing protein [Metabacillus sp. B2-18]|uniref:STAS domain-containing protein n=1 Tax=Metabacillus sp. B2-18 TaxID=2897333 RepID=UPI001E56223B|nr:STAS domain-containing protein [Metabacillus sp. B2-18]UGB31574.1 STAS domain-containing protein [Metabacillus sp. B2-18]